MTSLTSDSESISIGSKPLKYFSLNSSKLLSRYSDKGTMPCLCSGSNLSFSKFLSPTTKPLASVSLFRSHAIPKRSLDDVEFGAVEHSTIRLFLFFSSSSTKLCNRFRYAIGSAGDLTRSRRASCNFLPESTISSPFFLDTL